MCAVSGSAIILGSGVWEQADPAIHITADLLESSRALFQEKYTVGEWCEDREAFHARLREGDVQ